MYDFIVQAYKVSAEQQISAVMIDQPSDHKPDLENLTDAVRSIYDQYLSEKVFTMISYDVSSTSWHA